MRPSPKYLCLAALLLALPPARAQQDSTRPAPSTASRPNGRAPAKGPLPDPVLLDGSAQPPEKHPDYGMLGEFEIPGDENSKSDKVGGQQNPNQQGGGGQQQAQNQSQQQQGGGGQQGLPQAGGSAGAQQQANQAGQQGGGGAAGGPQQPNQNGQAGGGAAGQGDPNAKAEGIQVAGLEGDPSSQGGAGGAPGDNVAKPQNVAIGDKAMQINPAPNAPGVVGQASVANSTQQMESKIGKGSGPGPSQSTAGKGVEKGVVMPSGL